LKLFGSAATGRKSRDKERTSEQVEGLLIVTARASRSAQQTDWFPLVSNCPVLRGEVKWKAAFWKEH